MVHFYQASNYAVFLHDPGSSMKGWVRGREGKGGVSSELPAWKPQCGGWGAAGAGKPSKGGSLPLSLPTYCLSAKQGPAGTLRKSFNSLTREPGKGQPDHHSFLGHNAPQKRLGIQLCGHGDPVAQSADAAAAAGSLNLTPTLSFENGVTLEPSHHLSGPQVLRSCGRVRCPGSCL